PAQVNAGDRLAVGINHGALDRQARVEDEVAGDLAAVAGQVEPHQRVVRPWVHDVGPGDEVAALPLALDPLGAGAGEVARAAADITVLPRHRGRDDAAAGHADQGEGAVGARAGLIPADAAEAGHLVQVRVVVEDEVLDLDARQGFAGG